MRGLAGNIGISIGNGDSHFVDCIVVDYTVAIEVVKGAASCRLTRCHVWGGCVPPMTEGGVPEMLVDSINFRIAATDTILTDCNHRRSRTQGHVLPAHRLTQKTSAGSPARR